MNDEIRRQREQLQQTIDLLEAQRAILGDTAVDAALSGLREKLAQLDTSIPSAPAAPIMDMEGERKLVTIMFADIANFTAMSERMDPEDVRRLLNDCFSELVPVVETFGGIVDKFIGDEIMALFGAPVAQENDAECALRAALTMMTALTQFNARNQTNLGLHFGINTGIVIAGGIGSTKQQQYSVMGDAVNLAARLEDASATGEILVGPSTYQLTAQLFDFEIRSPIALKGKAKPVPIYRLIGLKETPGSTRGIPGFNSPLVGRTAQLAQLQQAVQELQTQTGQVVAVIGEPGLGKSRLVSEIRQAEPSLHWLETRGQSFAQYSSYGVAQNLLNNIIGVSMTTPAAEVIQRLREHIQQVAGERADYVYPYIARLRDLPLTVAEEMVIRSIIPDVMQQRMRQAFGELVLANIQTKPTLLVWEDLHWADPSSLQLIDYLITLTSQHPLVMLLVFRPKEGAIWDYHQRWSERVSTYQSITLGPLTDNDSDELIDNLLAIDNLPANTRQLILSKAEGNPFFLEELLRSLLDAGMLLMQDGRIRVVDAIQQLIIPDTLHGVIESRIDRLRNQEKQTLQTASVIGRIFDQSVLSYLADQGKRLFATDVALDALQERELIRQRELSEYIFKHAVTQDVAYHSLLMSRRRELHRLAAQAIETLFPTQVDEFSPALAWHYQCAQANEQALHYLVKAAERAQRTFSHAEAATFYRTALDMYQQTARQEPLEMVRLSEQLGAELVLLGQFDEARLVYQQARHDLPGVYVIENARLWRREGESYIPQRQSLQELEHYEKAENALGQPNAPTNTAWWGEWLDCQLARIWSLYWLNRPADIVKVLAKAEPVLQQQGTARQQTLFYQRLAMYQMRQNRYRLSLPTVQVAEKALAAAYQTDDHSLIAISLNMLGMVNYFAGNIAASAPYLQRGLSWSERIGDLQNATIGLQFLLQLYRYTDDVEHVRQYAIRMNEAIKRGKIGAYQFVVEGTHAWLAWKEGNPAAVEQYALSSLALHANIPIPNGFVLWLLIGLYHTQHRLADAMPHVQNLLRPTQVGLPDDLEQAVQQTITAWENQNVEQADEAMSRMITLAQTYHLLPATPAWAIN